MKVLQTRTAIEMPDTDLLTNFHFWEAFFLKSDIIFLIKFFPLHFLKATLISYNLLTTKTSILSVQTDEFGYIYMPV